jgi:tetratricopeptide (TPR) repeat protein
LLAAAALLVAANPAQQPQLRDLESRAAAARSRGDAPAALAAWEQAVALDPKSARVQDEIGFLLAVLNRHDEALRHFVQALELDAKFAPAQYHLGVAFWLAGDQAQAVPHLQSAAALDPKSFDYRL